MSAASSPSLRPEAAPRDPIAQARGAAQAREAVRVECRLAHGRAELDAHFEVRRAVFVTEQHVFAADDRDEWDGMPDTLHALGLVGDAVVGAVRLYRLERGGSDWKGDRLAVLPGFRTHHLGPELVRFAVRTAGSLGGSRMIAHVQLPNVRLFERLGWRPDGEPVLFHGLDHQLMWINLKPPATQLRSAT